MIREPWALVVPGQGSHLLAFTDDVDAHLSDLRALAAELAGADVLDRASNGTRYAQPALFLAAVARWRAMGAPRATVVAGHSSGEYAALVLAGRLGDEAGLRLIDERARLMAGATDREPAGGMVALLEWSESDLTDAVARHGLVVANENSHQEVVVAGSRAALTELGQEAQAHGRRAVMLNVDGAFHSPAMASVIERLRAALEATTFCPGWSMVLSGLDARPLAEPVRQLSEACVQPVRWRDVVGRIASMGVRRVVDVDPSNLLGRLVRATAPAIWTESLTS